MHETFVHDPTMQKKKMSKVKIHWFQIMNSYLKPEGVTILECSFIWPVQVWKMVKLIDN